MCLFKKSNKEININYFQTKTGKWFNKIFLEKEIITEIYSCLSDDINIGTQLKNRFKYYYGKIPEERLEILTKYEKDYYNIIVLNNMYARTYLDTYLEKTNFWKKTINYYRYKPLSYFLLHDTETDILYPFMSFRKSIKDDSEYFCLAYYPIEISNNVINFSISYVNTSEENYICNKNIKKIFIKNPLFIKYLNID